MDSPIAMLGDVVSDMRSSLAHGKMDPIHRPSHDEDDTALLTRSVLREELQRFVTWTLPSSFFGEIRVQLQEDLQHWLDAFLESLDGLEKKERRAIADGFRGYEDNENNVKPWAFSEAPNGTSPQSRPGTPLSNGQPGSLNELSIGRGSRARHSILNKPSMINPPSGALQDSSNLRPASAIVRPTHQRSQTLKQRPGTAPSSGQGHRHVTFQDTCGAAPDVTFENTYRPEVLPSSKTLKEISFENHALLAAAAAGGKSPDQASMTIGRLRQAAAAKSAAALVDNEAPAITNDASHGHSDMSVGRLRHDTVNKTTMDALRRARRASDGEAQAQHMARQQALLPVPPCGLPPSLPSIPSSMPETSSPRYEEAVDSEPALSENGAMLPAVTEVCMGMRRSFTCDTDLRRSLQEVEDVPQKANGRRASTQPKQLDEETLVHSEGDTTNTPSSIRFRAEDTENCLSPTKSMQSSDSGFKAVRPKSIHLPSRFKSARATTMEDIVLEDCRHTMRTIVLSPWFEYMVGALLMLNAISIGVKAEFRAQNPSEKAPVFFKVSETIFGLLFTVELVMRLYVFRKKFLRIKGWQWNLFDLIVVSLQIVEAFFDLFLSTDGVGALSFLRLLRLGRVVRLLRMVRLVPELKSMVYLIAASMQSFFWTLVLLSLLMYGLAVHLADEVSEYRESNPSSDLSKLEDGWGSVLKSINSLYQSILGGIDWKELYDELERISWSVPMLFVMYVAFASLVMLNLVTGVFVEGAQRIVTEDRDAELVKQAKRMFNIVDDSADHQVTWDEFQSHLEDPGMAEYFRLVGISRKEAKDLFQLLDLDSSGTLSVKEFVHGCLGLRGPAKSLDLARLAYNHELQGNRLLSIEQKLDSGNLGWSAELCGRRGIASENVHPNSRSHVHTRS